MKKSILLGLACLFILVGCNEDSPETSSIASTESQISSSNESTSQISPIEKYYANVDFEKHGKELKSALSVVILPHKKIEYDELWEAFKKTDAKSDGTVYDMYSLETFHFGEDKDEGHGGNKEGDYYNREHSIPNSWFGGNKKSPMYTDLFHLYPTDKFVNNQRGNYPYGEVDSPSKTFKNGSKMGPCSFDGYNGTCFEPIDEYKGDFARTYFYFVTCYEKEVINQTSEAKVVFVKEETTYTLSEYAKKLFLKWDALDPISEKEKNRNEQVYLLQNNRNPYIDFPSLAQMVFSD